MPEIRLADGRSIPYRIRVSPRSRRVRLTINPRDGLVLVTPPGVDRRWLMDLAEGWHEWVARQIEAMGMNPEEAPVPADSLPDELWLQGVGERWRVLYRYSPGSAARVRRVGSGLLLSGDCADTESCHRALRRWLSRRGADVLPGLLAEVSRETGLAYRSVSVRGQRSRWGSCSVDGDISLNYHLLFLPPEWVRHILIHELCHTVELNHSPRFWQTVERFDPDYTVTRKAMRRAWSHVPHWAVGPR